ncbi:MAG TPA: MBL fold metallo-hydrolase, partial [Chitinophaga sp.]
RTGGVNALARQGIATYASARTVALCRQHGSPVPAHAFYIDTTFRFGGTAISTFYPGAGHTLDNIVVWLPAEKLLFGGCLVKSTEAKDLGYTADGDVKAWPAAIAALRRHYPGARVIPGHQGWAGDPLQHTLDLLQE